MEYIKDNDGYLIPVLTSKELEVKKINLLRVYKEDKETKHLPEKDLKLIVDTFYKLEVKFGFIIIKE